MQNCTGVDQALRDRVGLQVPNFVEHLLPQLVELVRAARRLPVGEEHAIRRGSREFQASTKELGQLSLAAAHRALRFLDESARFEEKFEDSAHFNAIVDSIDNVLERVDACIQDCLAGAGGDEREGADGQASSSAALGSAGAENKPQVRWRHLIDNERSAFVPRLPVKHNQQVPLQPEIVAAQQRAGILLGRGAAEGEVEPAAQVAPLPHPYEAELNALSWPDSFFQLRAADRFLRMEDTPLVQVNTEEALREMISEIKATCVGKEIAVDVEHHDTRSYRGFVCLVQISTRLKDFVVDPFSIFAQMHALNEVFTDPRILKVLHGAERDVIWLQRDFSVYIVNMFDTGLATRALRLQGGYSLANLVSLFCGVKLDKKYQTSDWRQRPLPEEMVQYARCDTHYLLYCYDRLRNALLAFKGTKGPVAATEGEDLRMTQQGVQALQGVLERSTDLCRQRYTEEPLNAPEAARRLCERFGSRHRPLIPRQLGALQGLVAWRDRLARRLDESCGFISPDACLWRIALTMPTSVSQLRSSCNPLPPILQEHAAEIVQLLLRCPEDGALPSVAESQAPAQPTGARASAVGGQRAATAAVSSRPVAGRGAAASSTAPAPREWPSRSCGAPRPVLSAVAAADARAAKRLLAAAGGVSALLSMLAWTDASAEEEEEEAEGDQDVQEPPLKAQAVPARLGDRLKSIEGTMTFTAAPPEPPPVDAGALAAAAAAAASATTPAADAPDLEAAAAVQEEPADAAANVRRKKRKRGQAPPKSLESVVRATVFDPYASVEDPYL